VLALRSEEKTPMKILFMMTGPRVMKYYAGTLRFLLEGGHTVQVAYFSLEKHKPGTLHDELSAEYPDRFRCEIVPGKPHGIWRDLSIALAWAADYLFFLQPALHGAYRLRQRVEVRVQPAFVWLMNRSPGFKSPTGTVCVSKLVETVDNAIPASWTFKRYIRRINPDVVLASPLLSHSGMQWEYVRAAKALGIPTACCVASWDNLTTKGALRGRPDRIVVWNAIQKTEAVELHGVSPEQVLITGAQYFDDWFVRHPSRNRETFCKEVGLPPDRPILLYMCSSNFMAPAERAFVAKWITALRRSRNPDIAKAGILIRPYPEYAGQWQKQGFHTDGVTVWPPKGEYTITEEAKRNFYDSVYHSLAVVGVNTTAMIESAIIGKCVLSIKAEEFTESQDNTPHFGYLKQENGGPLFLADSMEAHLLNLQAILESEERFRQQTLKFVQFFARPAGLNKAGVPELARVIEDVAKINTRHSVSLPTFLLRLVLYPVAALVRASGLFRHFSKQKSKHKRKAALRAAAQEGADPLTFLKK
jgi:hypothetical protein